MQGRFWDGWSIKLKIFLRSVLEKFLFQVYSLIGYWTKVKYVVGPQFLESCRKEKNSWLRDVVKTQSLGIKKKIHFRQVFVLADQTM